MCVNTTIQAKTLRLAHNYTYMLIHVSINTIGSDSKWVACSEKKKLSRGKQNEELHA